MKIGKMLMAIAASEGRYGIVISLQSRLPLAWVASVIQRGFDDDTILISGEDCASAQEALEFLLEREWDVLP